MYLNLELENEDHIGEDIPFLNKTMKARDKVFVNKLRIDDASVNRIWNNPRLRKNNPIWYTTHNFKWYTNSLLSLFEMLIGSYDQNREMFN